MSQSLLPTLREKLKGSDSIAIHKAFEDADGCNDFTLFMSGADYEYNRLAPIHEKLLECVAALEQISEWTKGGRQDLRTYQKTLIALAALKKACGVE